MITFPHVVILAGGGGTRLWPASRRTRPKFLMTIHDDRTLLDAALHRATLLTTPSRIWVITGAEHADETEAVLRAYGARMVIEPSSRDTAPSLVLAATLIEREDPGAVAISMPADHLIDETVEWVRSVSDAVDQAQLKRIACVGVRPRTADSNLGYVEAAAPDPTSPRIATAFHEKPDSDKAREYSTSPDHFWNTAIMSWRSDVLLTVAATYAYELDKAIAAAVDADGTIDADRWAGAQRIAAEPALIEPAAAAGYVALVPASFDWMDVGTWAAVADLPGQQSSDHVATLDSRRPFVYTSNSDSRRKYAIVGLDDVIVVDCGDVVLITDRNHAARVKHLVSGLPHQGWGSLL